MTRLRVYAVSLATEVEFERLKMRWKVNMVAHNFEPEFHSKNIIPDVLKNEYAVWSEKEKEGYNTRTSPGVTHPSTALAQARLNSVF